MLQFVAAHAYVLLFSLVLIEQLGVPLPGAPMLLAAGALARTGQLSVAVALTLAPLASVIGHAAWFFAALALALALYLLIKYRERRRVLRDLALTRIAPHEVKKLLDDGVDVLIVDVRHPRELSGGTLPGALALSFEALEGRAQGMP